MGRVNPDPVHFSYTIYLVSIRATNNLAGIVIFEMLLVSSQIATSNFPIHLL
jgi:hypothetical protein